MIPKRLQAYLQKQEIAAEAVSHRTVYTAYDLAQTTGLKLEQIAKTVLLSVQPGYGEEKAKYVLAVVPASHDLVIDKIKRLLKVKKVSFAKEVVMSKLFKVKPGAMVPFGAMHKNIPVIVDSNLAKMKKILVRSGSFTDSLFVRAKDVIAASEAVVGAMTKKAKRH
ncbi:hypothetical protein COV04_01515 [Candidatus Uhrbacteria bacterium CG10_big_fil_rev_8_21_14_0_10_48_11]|uniref:YbaK/aminoacyl-tRNA synthetase-associated domain-containing protein n=1 Tax=Candidatus Uhrbacteria bacterium CG10_big_fil_rev_8_21_14_0_10_48_11 TaxID=1975037 RepID=A0A2M8LEZ0_9BACT|nr:MAG: hypothetical protein COV04_01515 [Candidatus Uhrbacteria bacterium CG10_big_fil_rev_8_21_14_0_10_48_11]